METHLTPEIEAQLRTLCTEISVAQQLDEEVQEELYGHLEDKYLAYINEEEKIGPQDAVILVREHFGETTALQELLRDVHGSIPGVSFWRGIAAVFISYQSINILLLSLTLALYHYLGGENAHRSTSALYYPYMFLAKTSFYLQPLFWILLLRFWLRQREAGKTLWFMRRHTEILKVLALITFLLSSGLIYITYIRYTIVPAQLPVISEFFFKGLYEIILILTWIWWMDHVYTGPRSKIWVVGVWIGSTTIYALLVQCCLYSLNDAPLFGFRTVPLSAFSDLIYGGAAIFFFSLYRSWRSSKLTLSKP